MGSRFCFTRFIFLIWQLLWLLEIAMAIKMLLKLEPFETELDYKIMVNS